MLADLGSKRQTAEEQRDIESERASWLSSATHGLRQPCGKLRSCEASGKAWPGYSPETTKLCSLLASHRGPSSCRKKACKSLQCGRRMAVPTLSAVLLTENLLSRAGGRFHTMSDLPTVPCSAARANHAKPRNSESRQGRSPKKWRSHPGLGQVFLTCPAPSYFGENLSL